MSDFQGSYTTPQDPKFKKSVKNFKKNSLLKKMWSSPEANKPFGGEIKNTTKKVKEKIK
jgi:hypothetical protein